MLNGYKYRGLREQLKLFYTFKRKGFKDMQGKEIKGTNTNTKNRTRLLKSGRYYIVSFEQPNLGLLLYAKRNI